MCCWALVHLKLFLLSNLKKLTKVSLFLDFFFQLCSYVTHLFHQQLSFLIFFEYELRQVRSVFLPHCVWNNIFAGTRNLKALSDLFSSAPVHPISSVLCVFFLRFCMSRFYFQSSFPMQYHSIKSNIGLEANDCAEVQQWGLHETREGNDAGDPICSGELRLRPSRMPQW